jgi:hypothetical protein
MMMSKNEHLHGSYLRRRMNVGWKQNADRKRSVSLHRSEVRLMMMVMSKNERLHGMYPTMTMTMSQSAGWKKNGG